MRRRLVILALVLGTLCAQAADEPLTFDDPQRQARYDALLNRLRCLVCQNQSLADSHAELAQDLRREVHRLIAENRPDDEVTAYLVERYGDFVLYRPPLKATTWLLWAGPFVLLAVAALVIMRFSGRRRAESPPALSPSERARLAALLDEERERG